MSLELNDAIDNARFLLETAIPALADGSFGTLQEVHGVGTCFRSRGVCELLLRGVADPLQIAQMQSSSVYLYALSRATEDEKVTSLGGCLWDAIAARYWDAAAAIARASRMTPILDREHEDDFLYVAYLLQRFFSGPGDDAPEQEREAHAQAQQQRLDRWEEVLEGGIDVRLDLARALEEGDAEAFAEALLAMADTRDADLKWRLDKGALKHDQMVWLQPIWPEGLALVRLGEEREGFDLRDVQVPGVPPVLRVDNPYAFHPDAWRSIDFRPARRP